MTKGIRMRAENHVRVADAVAGVAARSARTPRRIAFVVPLVVALMSILSVMFARPGLAQEFVKVDGQARESLPAEPFLAGAYGFIWLAVLVYLVLVARGLKRTNAEIEDLRKRVDSAQ